MAMTMVTSIVGEKERTKRESDMKCDTEKERRRGRESKLDRVSLVNYVITSGKLTNKTNK